MNIKEQLLKHCNNYVNKCEYTVFTTINSNKKALNSETKSSAGDKHETGRAMLQLEMEKAGQQLHSITLMKEVLVKVDVSKQHSIAHLGSLIITDVANYFLSIGAGLLTVDNQQYFAISVSSPIGKLLLGKKEGDKIIFNSKSIIIKTIS